MQVKKRVARWLRLRKKNLNTKVVVKLAMVFGLIIATIFQVKLSFDQFLSGKTTFLTHRRKSYEFPNISVSVKPFYDPIKLLDLGMDCSAESAKDLGTQIWNGIGLPRNTIAADLMEMAFWDIGD